MGAGPSGCAAALDLARENVNVLLLEKRNFPRVKPCGGALTVKAVRALRFSIEPIVRSVVTDFVSGRELIKSNRFSWPHPIAAMTVREELDQFALEKTLQTGAKITKIGRITEISENGESVTLATEAGRFTARFLIGADGANSTVRRLTGPPLQNFGFAIEGQVADSTAKDTSMTFDFGVVPRGYGWVFPKGDHFNVGIYTYDAQFRLFPEQLRWYAKRKLDRADISHIVGCPLGMEGWASDPKRGRVFLVGDAAGLCEPVLGEGIYYAIKSGQIAAKSILAEMRGGDARSEYSAGMKYLHDDLRLAAKLAKGFYRDLGLSYLALTSPIVRYALMKGYSLGIPLGKIPLSIPALPFKPSPPALYS